MGKIKLIEAARFKGRVSGVGDCVAGAQIIWSKNVQRKCRVSFQIICTFSSNLDDFPQNLICTHAQSVAHPEFVVCGVWAHPKKMFKETCTYMLGIDCIVNSDEMQ